MSIPSAMLSKVRMAHHHHKKEIDEEREKKRKAEEDANAAAELNIAKGTTDPRVEFIFPK